MKKNVLFIAAFCAAALVSCTPKELVIEEPETIDNPKETTELIHITIKASMSESTKATISTDRTWTWDASDKLAVFDGTTVTKEFGITEILSDGQAIFEGDVASTEGLKAVFPYSAALSDGSYKLSSSQTISTGQTVDPAAMVATATGEKASGTDFTFYFTPAVSFFKLTVDAGVDKVVLHCVKKEDTIAGDSRSLSVTVPGGDTYWVPVNPLSYTGIRAFVHSSGGWTLKAADSATIALSKPGSGKNLGNVSGGAEVSVIENADNLISYLGNPALDGYIVNDLDLTGKTITSCDSFAETFDGQYHSIGNWTASNALFATNAGTIQNLAIDNTCKINRSEEIAAHTGISFIVSKTNTGTVKDCEVAGTITVNSEKAGAFYCAGVVGESTSGNVEGCIFSGSIDVTLSGTSADESSIAGVVARVGEETTTANKIIVSDCENTGSVKFLFSGAAKAMKKFGVGGVVGQTVTIANATNDYGIIHNCVNKGSIEWEYTAGGTGSYPALGGVAGIIEGKIEGCSNYGSLKYSGSKTTAVTDASIGGVAGYVTLGAKDCHNYGTITLDAAFAGGTAMAQNGGNTSCSSFGGVFGAAGEYAGGEVISGTKDKGTLFAPPTSTVLVENCTNEVALTLNPKMIQSGGPKFLLGGVIGSSTANLKNCKNTKNIAIVSQPRWIVAGGVAGLATGNLISCNNEGELAVDADKENHPSTVASQHYVGGVVGYVGKKGVTIEDCHNTKAVSMVNISTTPGTFSYLGGLMGSYVSSATMTSCSNSGSVTYNAEDPICLGGIAGAFNGTMTGTSNSGTVTNASSYTSPTAGKEAEVGGLVGYANATLTNCENSGNVSNAAAGGFSGGFVGGLGDANLKWTDCQVNCSVTGASTGASVLGRFRNNGTKTLTLGAEGAPFTIMGTAASLSEVGELNGNSVELANVVK